MADSFPNPLGGDPDTVQRDATVYAETADAIARAAYELRQLGTKQFQSRAIDAIGGDADEIAGTVTRAHVRYKETAEALLTYAVKLREAQEQALRALGRNTELQDRLARLRYEQEETQRLAQTPGPDQQLHIMRLTQINQELQEFQQYENMLLEEWRQASAYKEHAAVEAMNRISNANEANDLNDGFWDFLGDILDIVKVIVAVVNIILKIVSIILTVLAVIFAVLAVFFPLFAAVAALLFGYAQLVNLAIAVLALLQFLMNGFHLLDLVLVGVAVLAAFGGSALGNALGAAAKSAAQGALGALGEGAAKLAGDAAAKLVSTGVETVVDQAVEGILSLGSPDAQALFDAVSPMAEDFLETEFADGLAAFEEGASEIGGWVGDDFAAGFKELGLDAAVAAVAAPGGLAIDAAYGAYRDAGNALGGALSDIGDSLGFGDGSGGSGGGIGGALHDVGAAFDHAVQGVGDGILSSPVGDLLQEAAPGSASDHVQNDLASVFGGHDVSDQVSKAVTGIVGDVIGGLPGGSQAASALGGHFGELAQSTADAAKSGHSGASLVGAGHHD